MPTPQEQYRHELELFKNWLDGEVANDCLKRMESIFLNQRSQVQNAMWQQNSMAASYIMGQESVVKWLLYRKTCSVQEESEKYDDGARDDAIDI